MVLKSFFGGGGFECGDSAHGFGGFEGSLLDRFLFDDFFAFVTETVGLVEIFDSFFIIFSLFVKLLFG